MDANKPANSNTAILVALLVLAVGGGMLALAWPGQAGAGRRAIPPVGEAPAPTPVPVDDITVTNYITGAVGSPPHSLAVAGQDVFVVHYYDDEFTPAQVWLAHSTDGGSTWPPG